MARLYQAINAERVAVAAALGAEVPDLEDWFERIYGVRGATLVETCQLLTTNSDGPYQATGTPRSWAHKYIAEDVPVGLDADARARPRRRRADPGDRRRHQVGANPGRQRFRRRRPHARPHGPRPA